jgi:hypothetical protein
MYVIVGDAGSGHAAGFTGGGGAVGVAELFQAFGDGFLFYAAGFEDGRRREGVLNSV